MLLCSHLVLLLFSGHVTYNNNNTRKILLPGMLTRPEVDEAEANSHEADAKIAFIFQPNFTF